MSAALGKRIAEEFAALGDSLPGAVVSREHRRQAIARLAASGLPSSREENWRYANLRALERVRYAPAAPRAPATVAAADLPAGLAGFARYVFVDGALVPALCAPVAGGTVSVRSPGRDSEATAARAGNRPPPALPAAGTLPEARLALLNEAFAIDSAEIHAGKAGAETRIELLFVAVAAADSGASYPRVRVNLDPDARLILLERHVSAGAGANFVNSAVSVGVGRGARLTHYRLQQAGERATWVDSLSAVLAADAHYRLLAVGTGALAARATSHIQLAGEGAAVSFAAAAVGDRQQVLDHYALIEHIAARTRTEQTFRGIASGRARVAFNGKIVVREGARGTDSSQSLRGLLAGPEAEIDVRPQLEIYTDEVRCSHGATAGKLDEGMLFYLLSRGLAPEVAQRLLEWAFLEDVVARIEPTELRRRIEHDLAGHRTEFASIEELR